MTQEQQKVLEQFDDSTLFHFLREIRHKAFISWATDDVIGMAEQQGFVMDEEKAIDIIANIDRHGDCEHGITWETLNFHIGEWISENSFEVDIKVLDTDYEYTALFCSLETNENIEEFWNDDSYYYYGMSKEEVSTYEGGVFENKDCAILKVW